MGLLRFWDRCLLGKNCCQEAKSVWPSGAPWALTEVLLCRGEPRPGAMAAGTHTM